MPWAFGATGSKDQCLAQLESSAVPEDAENAQQYKLMLSVLKSEIERYGDDSLEMNVAASGHAPDGGGERSFSIWISGKATPRATKSPPARASEPPVSEPPLSKRRQP